MGCWNQTCGLTQIHIRAGEKVMVFPLAESTDNSLCYTTPFWAPFPVPFYSEYNDYGAGENSSGIGLELALSEIQNKLIEVERGKNEFHDIAVKKEGFDEDLFWNAIHEQRLSITGGYQSKQCRVGMVMIKQSIFDYLAENYEFSVYVGWDRETNKSSYWTYTFKRVLEDLLAFIDVIFDRNDEISELADKLENDEQAAELKRILMRFDPLEYATRQMLSQDRPGDDKRLEYEQGVNRAADWLRRMPGHLSYGGGFSSGAIVNSIAGDFVESGDRDGMLEFLTEVLKTRFIDNFMMITRKFWSPQAGCGSQNDDPDGYQALIAAMSHVLAEEKARWNEED